MSRARSSLHLPLCPPPPATRAMHAAAPATHATTRPLRNIYSLSLPLDEPLSDDPWTTATNPSSAEAIRSPIQLHEVFLLPVVGFFSRRPKLRTVNGSLWNEVHMDIFINLYRNEPFSKSNLIIN